MPDAPENRNRRVEDYARGIADDEAARQLEIELLDDDELFERVQNEDLLRRGFGESERVPSSTGSIGENNTGFPPRLGWALAASLGAIAVLLGIYSLQLNERIETLQSPTAGLKVITLFEQRSLMPEAADPSLQLAGHEGPVFLEIDVSAHEYDSFELELVREEGTLIREEQVPDDRGYLTVLAPRAQDLQAIILRSPKGKVLKSYEL